MSKIVSLSAIFLLAWMAFDIRGAMALDCATVFPQNFERSDDSDDPTKSAHDVALCVALARSKPIIFRGRVAHARALNNVTTNTPVTLIEFKDVDVLKGALPRVARDRKAFIVDYGWCDGHCQPAEESYPKGQTFAFGVDLPRQDVAMESQRRNEYHYHGRIDGVTGACSSHTLSSLDWELLKLPIDEIERLERDYPFHPIQPDQTARSAH